MKQVTTLITTALLLLLCGCGSFNVDPRDSVKEDSTLDDYGVEPYVDNRDRDPKPPIGDKSREGRPSVETLIVSAKKNAPQNLTPKQVRCVAEVFYNSPLTNNFLDSLVNNENYDPNSLDMKYILAQPFTDKMATCYGYADYVEMQKELGN